MNNKAQLSLFSNETPISNGIKSPKNTLNDLTGKEWIYRTNSIELFESNDQERELNKFIVEILETKYSTAGSQGYGHKLRKVHPSPKPPQLMKLLIEFFSKENEMIFDPFMGVGGTLIGASLCNRKAIGIDLSETYIDVYKEVSNLLGFKIQKTIVGDSNAMDNIEYFKNIEFDLILTDPPYSNMMTKAKTGEASKRKKNTAPTPFTHLDDDIGNLSHQEFLNSLKTIILKSIKKLKNKRYVIVFTKDFQPSNEYHGMLHYDIVTKLTEIDELKYKGMKIWYDKTINLYPYGYPYAYVGNQLHQYVLIFRKEEAKKKKCDL